MKLPMWGMAGAPLVDSDQLIVLAGGANGALIVSFDKHTGKELWRSWTMRRSATRRRVIFEFGGKRQLIAWHPKAVSRDRP